MDEKTMQALTALANKLGTTAEYLWGVLLKQAPISAATDFFVIVAWAFAVAVWAMFVKRKTQVPPETENNRYPQSEWIEEGKFFAWASVFIAASLVAIFAGACLSSVVDAVFNPEYWALKKILM